MRHKHKAKSNAFAVVVRVSKEGYVPKGMRVDVRISPTFFTAKCESREVLEAARADPLVVVVTRGKTEQ